MKSLVQISALFLCVSAVAEPVDFSNPLPRETVESLAIGGTLKLKKSKNSLRVLCVDLDHEGCKKVSFAALSENENGTIKVNPTQDGIEIHQFINEIETLLEQGRLGKRTGRFDSVTSYTPAAGLGVGIGFILGYGANSMGVFYVSSTVLGAAGLAVDVVTAPIRLPINLVKRIVYTRKLRKYLKSLVRNDHDAVIRMKRAGFEAMRDFYIYVDESKK